MVYPMARPMAYRWSIFVGKVSKRPLHTMSSRWKSDGKSACPIFALNCRVHSAARTSSGPPISLLTRLRFSMWFDPSRLQWESEISFFNNEFVFFCINNQAQVLSTCQIVVSKGFWRFFDAVRGFYINSTPESNSLFGNNGGCVYPLSFFHKPLRRLHYRRRGNSGFQHADKPIRAIFD